MGVSGGGGDPRLARVVDVLAVEANRLTELSFGILKVSGFEAFSSAFDAPGGGG
jgi:hypothetical protein